MEIEVDPKARDSGVDAGGQRPALLRWVDGILSGAIPASQTGAANGSGESHALRAPAPAQTIVYYACPECRAATLQTEDGPVSVSEKRIGELTPISNVLEIGSEEELPAKGLPVDQLDPPNSASLARRVVQRDGARCSNPGCESRSRLNAHHIVFRTAGGSTCLANEIALCDRRHAMIHAGLLEVTGSPYTNSRGFLARSAPPRSCAMHASCAPERTRSAPFSHRPCWTTRTHRSARRQSRDARATQSLRGRCLDAETLQSVRTKQPMLSSLDV